MIDYVFLGSGGGMPMTFRSLSSVMLNYNGRRILLDCGEGTQVQMRRYHTGFRDVDIIFVSHLHGDHIFGIPGLLSTMGNSDRTEKVVIVGPKGIKPVMDGLLYSLRQLPFEVEIIEGFKEAGLFCGKETLKFSDLDSELIVKSFQLRHRIECLGYSFELKRKPKFNPERAKELGLPIQYWKFLQNGSEVEYEGKTFKPSQVLGEDRRGLKLTFIGDTGYFKELSDFADESDLLICEGTYGDDEDLDKAKKNRHMTFRQAATIAKDAKAKKLIITHFSPSISNPTEFKSNATEIFKDSIIAFDGLKGTVQFEED